MQFKHILIKILKQQGQDNYINLNRQFDPNSLYSPKVRVILTIGLDACEKTWIKIESLYNYAGGNFTSCGQSNYKSRAQCNRKYNLTYHFQLVF